jgi:addiction module RelB/DinJ family antitoxin
MNTNINIRPISELKTNEFLKRLEQKMSTTVNIFLTQIVKKNSLPFEISAPPPKTAKLGG